jgi:hypothetical protein
MIVLYPKENSNILNTIMYNEREPYFIANFIVISNNIKTTATWNKTN